MQHLKRYKTPLLISGFLVAITVLFAIAYWQAQPRNLYPQEIRSYQGQNLSSIADVKENAIRGTQDLNESTYRLLITGLVNKTLNYTYGDVVNNHQKYLKVVPIHCVEGWSAKILWEGVLVRDLLLDAGINPRTQVVIFYGSENYSTSLPLNYFMNNDIILAYKMNNVTMPPERGFPFELVAEGQYGYKWIKWITRIELSDNVNYKGYWESRGYPNDANVP